MSELSSDTKAGEGENVSMGGADDLSNNEQPPTSTTTAEQSQSTEQHPPSANEKEASSEQPQDTVIVPEDQEIPKGGTNDQSAEGEGTVQDNSNTMNKSSDMKEQTGNEITTSEDGQVSEKAVGASEELSSEERTAGNEEEGQKEESTIDEQETNDQVEKGDTPKNDEQTTVKAESTVEAESIIMEDTEQLETGQQPHQHTEESAKVEGEEEGLFDSHAPTEGDTGVMAVSTLNEPLADILEEDEDKEPINREELLAETKEVLLEQERLKSVSAQLQHKIAEYLAKKKTEERPDPGRNVTDQEKRYSQCMAALEMLEMDLSTMQQRSEMQDAHLLVLREQKLQEVRKAAGEFAGYKKDIATTAVHSRTGRRLQTQEVEQFQAAEDKKESELILVRLENIKLQNKISKLEAQIKEKEQLAEGLHMIDFEQLKINNVDLNEKIEERNEDILKLRKKVTSTVQVLTHVKEKLQFLQAENGEKRAALRNIDEIVAKKRDHLTRTKQARDALRVDNLRLRQKGGLVGHPALLGDFEERKDQNDELRVVLEKLQQRHSELTVTCDGLRKKVEQARTIHPSNI